MTLFAVEPRDPVVFRDGRPFGAGASAASLPFPWPSTIAGFARTHIGSDARGRFVWDHPEALLSVPVRGPWLWRCDGAGAARAMAFPAPRDAVWWSRDGRMVRRRLRPIDAGEGCATDLPDHLPGLRLVGFEGGPPRGKPAQGPAFWTWDAMVQWLSAPVDDVAVDPDAIGLTRLLRERRVHVAVDGGTLTARDGMLFATEGLRFETERRERLALGFACDDARLRDRAGVTTIGGERRLAFLREAPGDLPPPPRDPPMGALLRVVLLTPAIFARGFAPAHIRGARVVAAVVGPPEVVSGWDLRARAPKPTRRAAPAGSVYWVEAPSDPRKWIEEVWMQSVSDDAQDARDGFGLAVVGAP